MGEDGDADFKLRTKKKLYQTDTSSHHDRFTMPWGQINECENPLNDDEKRDVRIGDGIAVTVVELGLGDTRHSMIADQLRLKQWNWCWYKPLCRESDHLQGRTNGVLEGLMHASDRTL
ncbi:hypothetical protein POTOM_045425 [Populus tomentosa]|uniref:Uncharacterized protein n=1 Tax=Populus tomentosa TaxID=118781 RepID=A0A8X7YTH8_POPTO|nr:hypothetical protein POTOM_045425 [Populus tomentosa]